MINSSRMINPGVIKPIDDAEYAERLRRVHAVLAERSWSALVVADPANLYYLTGYDAWSFYMPQCLIIPADGSPRLFLRAMDANGAAATARLPADRIEGYPESLVHRPDVHPYDWIADRARAQGLLPTEPDALIAVEADAHFYSVRAHQALAERVGRARLVDSGELVNWVRLIKSEAELDRLRVAGRLAEEAMRVALAAVAPGRRQCDVAAEIVAAQTRGTDDHGGDYPAIVPLLPSGDSAGTPHLTWSERRFCAGEATTIELAGTYQRYHAPLARTVMIGEPPARLAGAAAVIRDGMAAALEAMVPGRPVREAHTAFQQVIAAHGLTKDSRIGYSIGVGYPPDWGERTISLRGEEARAFGTGMAFHVILGLWLDGWGYELSEPVIISDGGAEPLCWLPRELEVTR